MVREGGTGACPPHGASTLRGRMWCHTRVQGFASVPEREVGGGFQREIGGNPGWWSRCCEHFEVRVGSTSEGVNAQKGSAGIGAGERNPAKSERAIGGAGPYRGLRYPLQDCPLQDMRARRFDHERGAGERDTGGRDVGWRPAGRRDDGGRGAERWERGWWPGRGEAEANQAERVPAGAGAGGGQDGGGRAAGGQLQDPGAGRGDGEDHRTHGRCAGAAPGDGRRPRSGQAAGACGCAGGRRGGVGEGAAGRPRRDSGCGCWQRRGLRGRTRRRTGSTTGRAGRRPGPPLRWRGCVLASPSPSGVWTRRS